MKCTRSKLVLIGTLLLASLLVFCQGCKPANAQTWTQISTTDWTTGSFGTSTTNATAGNTLDAGNGWIDAKGGVAAAGSLNQLNMAEPSSPFTTSAYLVRPTGENSVNQKGTCTFLAASTSTTFTHWWMLRYIGSNTAYLLGASDNAHASIYACVAGSTGSALVTVADGSFTVGDHLSMTATAVGTNPTTLTVQITDVTTSTTWTAATATDSTASLQTAGQMGLVGTNSTTDSWLTATTYAAPTYAASPLVLTPSSTGNTVTLTGIQTAWVNGTTTFSATAGTITSQVVNSATSATLTFSAPSSAGANNVTISDNTDGATTTLSTGTAATTYTWAGASPINANTATPYTISLPAGTYVASSVTITPAVSGVTGSYSPTTVVIPAKSVGASVSTNFTSTNTVSATATLSTTNSASLTNPSSLTVSVIAPLIIPVNSTAFHYSPGNWTGDTGRAGLVYRRTSWVGAYFDVYWTTTAASPTCTLQLINATSNSLISYWLDGNIVHNVTVPTTGNITVTVPSSGSHKLEVIYSSESTNGNRWNYTAGLKLTSVTVDGYSTAVAAPTWNGQWWMEVGDSISEGWLANSGSSNDVLYDYTYLTGAAGRAAGYDYCISACVNTGWLLNGLSMSVPAYYYVSGGTYSASLSRWNLIDANNSLLDSAGKISAYGSTGQQPSVITINYGTNECLNGATVSVSDMQTSIEQCLAALRAAAPNAWIVIYQPFGLYNSTLYGTYASTYPGYIRSAVTTYQATYPGDTKTIFVDEGSGFANYLQSITNSVHPQATGHAQISAATSGVVLPKLTTSGALPARRKLE